MSESTNKVNDDFEIDIEIVNDVPEADRGKYVAPASTENDDDIALNEDEISRYKNDVQKRMKDLSAKTHAERRAKEQAHREREEAVSFARSLAEENRRLKNSSSNTEAAMVFQAKARAEAEIGAAKRQAKEAFEAGDTDRFMELQEELQRKVIEHDRYSGYQAMPEESDEDHARNMQRHVPARQPEAPSIPQPDAKAQEWYKDNSWFQGSSDTDQEMTAYAFGVSDILIKKKNIDPRSDKYYEEINLAVRRRFPEVFGSETKGSAVIDATRKPTSVVAPAGRSAKTVRKVQLTESQVRLAKRLGITNEQYAAKLV